VAGAGPGVKPLTAAAGPAPPANSFWSVAWLPAASVAVRRTTTGPGAGRRKRCAPTGDCGTVTVYHIDGTDAPTGWYSSLTWPSTPVTSATSQTTTATSPPTSATQRT